MTQTLTADELLQVPSAGDFVLPEDVVAQLPEATPPAPWYSNIEMAFWGWRSTAEAAAALAPGLLPGLPFGGAAFIHYLDGAVGPYREILAIPQAVRGGLARGTVPFIAVDSVASIHGGRANWALPKLRAEFTGFPVQDDVLAATGEGWTVGAQVSASGPWLPMRSAASCAQRWPDGSVRAFRSSFRGRARIAAFDITADGPASLTGWLTPGRRHGIVFRGGVTVGAPAVV